MNKLLFHDAPVEEEDALDVPMVEHPTRPEVKMPATLYIELENFGSYQAYTDPKEINEDLDPGDTVYFGVYVLKRFLKLDKVSDIKITEE